MNMFTGRTALALAVGLALAGSAQAGVVISQVYGGGGNNGATLRSDFVELHNNGATAVDLSGWSVQYASSSGTSWQRTNLSGTIAPGGYYLVKQGDGANTSAQPLPTPDATGTISMSGTAGKVMLVRSQATLSGACPTTDREDLVGFGAANCYEGAAPTVAPSNTRAVVRAADGCTDTEDNGADFTAADPAPRNSASPRKSCLASDLPVLTISDASAPEGDTATSMLGRFVARLDRPAGPGGVRFHAVTRDGTATAGEDYLAQGWDGVIAEGQTSVEFDVPVYGDTTTEADETLSIVISDVTGAMLADGEGLGTIVNDDLRPLTPIHDVQGNGARSPLAGQVVDIAGIVTGRKSNGFFVQAAEAEADADPATSEGVFVFTGGNVPAAAAIGNRVRVSGTVVEFGPTTDTGQAPLTEIGGNPTVTLLSTPDPRLPAWFSLPQPVELTTTLPDAAGPLDQLERLEGMRVRILDATVVAPTQGNTNEPNASGSSNGVFHVVVTGVPRPFREPGIQAPDAPPAGGTIPPIPRWDFNPELISVDSDALGAERLDLPAGARVGYLTGPLDYGFRRYTLLPEADSMTQRTVMLPPEAMPRPAAPPVDPDAFTVAGYNLERFFDTTNDPTTGEPVLTAAAFERRLAKASLAIRNYLNTPDILGTVEVENLPTLQTLAARINADAVATGQPDPRYVAYLVEGNDVGGIDVGFLVRTAEVGAGVSRIEARSVTQIGKDTMWTEPDGSPAILNDRPPLVLDAVVHYADGRAFPLDVVLVHQRSLNGAEDDTADGARIRLKRQRQAEFLAGYLNGRQQRDPSLRMVVLGDFNAFEFNDGLVDAMNVVAGTPTPDAQTVVPGDGVDYVDPDLIDLGSLQPASERYSFVFGGNAQTLDHVLVNEEMVVQTRSIALDHARINADFPEINRNDATSPSRLADHDPVLATFVPRHHADLSVSASADAGRVSPGQPLAFTAHLANLGPDAATAPGVGFAVDAELPSLTVSKPAPGWSCDAARVEAGRTSVACNAASLDNGTVADFAVSTPTTADMNGRTVNLAVAADAQSIDDVSGNDQASASATVQAVADLGVAVDGPAKHLRSGTVGHFPVTVRNAGPDAAPLPGLTLRGDAPAGNVALRAPQGWTCRLDSEPDGFVVRCDATTLALQASAVFDLAVQAPPRVRRDTLTIEATVRSAGLDGRAADDSAAYSVRVIGSPQR